MTSRIFFGLCAVLALVVAVTEIFPGKHYTSPTGFLTHLFIVKNNTKLCNEINVSTYYQRHSDN